MPVNPTPSNAPHLRRVLVLNQFALPRTQGGGTRHVDLFTRIPGWRPTIVAGDRNHYTQERFAEPRGTFRLVSLPASDAGAVSRLRGWATYAVKSWAVGLRERHVEAVVGSSPQLFAPLAALLIARMKHVPFLLEVRDLWPESIVAAGKLREGSMTHRLLSSLERFICRRADAVICVTGGWEDHLSSLGVATTKIHVVPNGTEPSDFQVDTSKLRLREEFGTREFTAVFAGAHGPKDGLDYILDAATTLPDIDFLLVGSGPSKTATQARAKSLGLSNVRFQDPVPKVELPRLLHACDVGVHAVTPLPIFLKGMSPNKLFDYLAAGLPVVSNAAPGLGRIMIDGECGRLGGADELAECLREVRDASPSRRAEWSANGRALLAERFSRQAAGTLLGSILDSAVARSRS